MFFLPVEQSTRVKPMRIWSTVTDFITPAPTTSRTLALQKVRDVKTSSLSTDDVSTESTSKTVNLQNNLLIFKEAQTQRELRASLSSHLLLLPPSLSPVSRVRRFSSGGEDDGWNQNINRVNKPTFSLSELLVIRSMTAHTIVPSLSLLHRASGG